MPAPVRPTTVGYAPAQPVHIAASRYSIDRFIVEPGDRKPAATIRYSAELTELMEELEEKKGCELVLASAVPKFNVVPTGIFTLDLALGGGWAEGFPSMIYGMGNSGKTTTVIKAIAGIQRKFPDHKCVLCDVETTFDPDWAEKNGVDLTRLLILNPSSAEEGADIMLGLTKVPEIAAIFLDSIPVFVPSKDFDDSMADAVMATRARLLSRFSGNLLQATIIERQNISDLNPYGHRFSWWSVNSWRNKIGLVFGDPRTLPGGDWQHTFHRTKIQLRSTENLDDLAPGSRKKKGEDGDDEGGGDDKKKKKNKGNSVAFTDHQFQVDKAKLPGTRNGEFKMILDPSHPLGLSAIDDIGPLGSWAKRLGVLRQSGKNLVSDLFDYTIGSREELEAKIMNDREFAEWLKLATILKQRIYLSMPPLPPDGYLVTPDVAPGRAKKKLITKPVVAAAPGKGFMRRG